MTWDAEQWRRRFEMGAADAERYVRENRGRIARNDPRSWAAQHAVDEYTAKADLCDALLGWTETSASLRHRVEQLSKGKVQYPTNIYDRSELLQKLLAFASPRGFIPGAIEAPAG